MSPSCSAPTQPGPSLAEIGHLCRSIADLSGRMARFEPVDRSEYDAVRVDVEHYTGET